MTTLIHEQMILFMVAIYAGVVMSLTYDLIKIMGKAINTGKVWKWVEDIWFWLCCSYVIYSIFLKYNYGQIRMFAFLGILLGMAIYFFLISNIWRKIITAICDFFVKIITKALKLLSKPIKIIASKLKLFGRKRVNGKRQSNKTRESRQKAKKTK